MKKRNLRPQQAAPVARETTATSFQQAQVTACTYCVLATRECTPFAGDGAE
ncbi:MAG: anacyclamide/piricyclamide family prenylated cyclic peptide [Gloeotrichia echinulata IR180]|jgi:prenylated cyclic peptide (anacyclamide/piricyclamide family)|nr:anacyclamide/piricyclamide family prenylated cyclic peptide [Gloeotrichia echinulata DEX184]